jgi:SAM-dependent methyltransferase
VRGHRALDFGCGTGRSTRFLHRCGFDVVGVDIAEPMIRKARQLDPAGDYRLIVEDDIGGLSCETYDLVLSAFTFDNVATAARKIRISETMRGLLRSTGRIVHVVSSPDIYLNEWVSFSTRDFPRNRTAADGETVCTVMLDTADRRPVEDVLCTDGTYREIFGVAGLEMVATYRPLATGDEGCAWISETTIAPWTIYVLRPAGAGGPGGH